MGSDCSNIFAMQILSVRPHDEDFCKMRFSEGNGKALTWLSLPRSHPAVQRPLNLLLRCIERMPCSGPLFTSQSPFFPVFAMGLMSYRDQDRRVVRNWFEHVLARAGARSVSSWSHIGEYDSNFTTERSTGLESA
jgi:hypothetical protein